MCAPPCQHFLLVFAVVVLVLLLNFNLLQHFKDKKVPLSEEIVHNFK